jgi:hypothetical protein
MVRTLLANGFELGWPAGWEDHSTIVLIGPPRPTFSPNIQVNREPVRPGVSLDEYFAAQRQELSTLGGFQLLDHGERMVGGLKAYHHSYTWNVPEGFTIRQLQVAVLRPPSIFTVTCSSIAGDWPDFEASFEMALAALRFT